MSSDSTESPSVEYREVPGWLGYLVGDDGSIWSRRKRSAGASVVRLSLNGCQWKRLNGTVTDQGRIHVVLSPGSKIFTVHSLVMLAFVGTRPKGMHICHWDGNPRNNRLPNLRYGTPRENSEDSARHGTRIKGAAQGAAKLNEARVLEMRRKYAQGRTINSLAKEYGVSSSTAVHVLTGKSWKHVKTPLGDPPPKFNPRHSDNRKNAKISEEQVREIRKRSAAGETGMSLSAAFGISQPAVSAIVTRRNWPNVI
jgi:hypothetical protein